MTKCSGGHEANSYGECLNRACADYVGTRNPPSTAPAEPAAEPTEGGESDG